MRIAVTGAGVLCPDAALSGADPEMRDAAREVYEQPLPSPAGHAIADFDIRRLLGRKGTGFLNRAAGLTLVAGGRAIQDAGLTIDDGNRARVGMVLGTTLGSFKSTADYTRETLVNPRPYLVNPGLFPNAVLNGAASQAAIRYGLKGVNATLAGGRIGFLSALLYATRALRHGHADAVLTGAVEEFTPDIAWTTHLATGGSAEAGEGAAMFVLEPADAAAAGGRRVLAEVLAVSTGFRPGMAEGDPAAVLARSLRGTLARAGLSPEDVALVGTAETAADTSAVSEVFGDREVEHLRLVPTLGECGAAAGGLQLAKALAGGHGTERIVLLSGWTPDGAFGAAALRLPATAATATGTEEAGSRQSRTGGEGQ